MDQSFIGDWRSARRQQQHGTARRAGNRRYVSAAQVLDAVQLRAEDAAAAKQVHLQFWVGGGGLVGELDRLVEALSHVVEGSIESSIAGGQVVVSSASTDDGGQLWSVRAPGSAVNSPLLVALGWPFHSAKAGGSGLLFAEACETFRSHGGEVHMHYERDLGTTIRITLPGGM